MPSILPTRFLSTPTPLPFRPQPTLPSPLLPELVHLLSCLFLHTTCSHVHSSTRQLTMLLIELVHLLPCLLSPPTCSLVHSSTRQHTMLLIELVHLLPCLLSHTTCSLVHSSTRQLARYSPNLFICYLVSSRMQLVPSSTHQLVNLPVTHRTCSSVTQSLLAYNLLTRLPINSSTCPLLPELVHLLPCLLIQLICSLVHPLTRLLVNYFYHLTFLSVLV